MVVVSELDGCRVKSVDCKKQTKGNTIIQRVKVIRQ
jgi:hypothetical protein